LGLCNPVSHHLTMSKRTIGGKKFKEYLPKMEYPFEFEQPFPGNNKRPDYTVTKDGLCLFDVKDSWWGQVSSPFQPPRIPKMLRRC